MYGWLGKYHAEAYDWLHGYYHSARVRARKFVVQSLPHGVWLVDEITLIPSKSITPKILALETKYEYPGYNRHPYCMIMKFVWRVHKRRTDKRINMVALFHFGPRAFFLHVLLCASKHWMEDPGAANWNSIRRENSNCPPLRHRSVSKPPWCGAQSIFVFFSNTFFIFPCRVFLHNCTERNTNGHTGTHVQFYSFTL